MTFVRNESILSQELDGEFVLYDPEEDAIHNLNETAYFVWKNCDGHCSASEIANRLEEQYYVSMETANGDVESILLQLHEVNLVQPQ